ncbi:MAG TPA: hypothetical protein PK490_12295 [Prosthecobacter sp.]|nr:hypothetical protein [Prosthecobacter sp.]HRK15067.1 hypothetical protein [Prosthecobacter sp.]
MSLQARAGNECAAMRARLASMRVIIGELEDMLPAARELLASLRVEMCCLATDINALDTTCGALRMTGQQPPLQPQDPVESTAHKAMLRSLHRAGDHTLDPEDDEGNSKFEIRNSNFGEGGGR